MTEHAVAQGRRFVHGLQTVVGRRSLVDVLHADPGAFPVMRGEHHLAVVSAGIAGGRKPNSPE
jgi:hypothetical protein